jgi:hypothetical protein
MISFHQLTNIADSAEKHVTQTKRLGICDQKKSHPRLVDFVLLNAVNPITGIIHYSRITASFFC